MACIVAGEHRDPPVHGLVMTGGPRLSSSPSFPRPSLSLSCGPCPSGLKWAGARAVRWLGWAGPLAGPAAPQLFWPGRHSALFIFLFLWLFQKFHRINYLSKCNNSNS